MAFTTVQETGRPVTIKDEGVSIQDDVASIDFVGGGVGGAALGPDVTETIPGASGNDGNGETPSGDINGSNKTYTLAQTPSPALSLKLFRNGQLQTAGEDYTLSGLTITMVNAPKAGNVLRAWYNY